MNSSNTSALEYMESEWDRINSIRDGFRSLINYEWNFFATINFHKNYRTTIENVEILIKRFLSDLRKHKKLTFSAFYIIPKSYIDPVSNPHHVHILFLVFNDSSTTKQTIEECANGYSPFNKCIVYELYEPEAGIYYVIKNKNFKVTDMDSVHYDFYREQLLRKYRNSTEYVNELCRIAYERRYNQRIY